MRISTSTTAPARAAADVLAVAVPKPARLDGAAAAIDAALGGRLQRLLDAGEIRGAKGQVTLVHTDDGVRARRVAVVGLGKEGGPAEVRLAAAAATRAAAAARAQTLAFALDGVALEPTLATRCAVDGATLAGYRFTRYLTGPAADRPGEIRSLTVLGGDRAQARLSAVLTEATNRARDLQNTPSADMGPQELAERARELAAQHPALTARVHDRAWMERRGMGLLVAVARASSRPPLVITLRHRPRRAKAGVVLGLVGKGITYDAGGVTLKPARSLVGMKFDMSGAAAVLEATGAVAELGLPIEVVTVIGATENLLDTSAVKPDDVVRAANGKTVEITNTDAEGRLVLADCLHHARSLGATHVVDVATLTGAVVTALGDLHAGLFARGDEFADRILRASDLSGDLVWRLPLHDTYKRFLRSEVADMVNGSFAGKGGPCYAARFLQEFAGDGDWAHLDIAGVADLEQSRGDEFGKGGTGFGVRLLVELARSMC
ncbi:MAG TPA: leucyl aminopeptidase family protein [Gaiellales bacterium]|jgi:leucyl aminopeptidase|nr:leucyl aminopeptidase family protein [Gaiellales bacterium]